MNQVLESTVGKIAIRHPETTRVFHRHNIDFCCGGGVSLEAVCAQKDLDLETVQNELLKEIAAHPTAVEDLVEASLTTIIDHILEEYHAPLRVEIPRILEMANKVAEVHGDKDERLGELARVFRAFAYELDQHMAKEEQILFPLIRSGRGGEGECAVSVMEQEHVDAGNALVRLRELADDYAVPEGACTTWRALWHALEEFEAAMHRHVNLENNLLFPRALGRES